MYYRHADLYEFQARVVAVTNRNGQVAVELDRTAFYPTSGGQPFDTGQLNDDAVVEVVDEGDTILHVLASSRVTFGESVRGVVDRERRIDHTQQHTGQHVLSQAFERGADLRTVSFHLGADASTIDLDRAAVSTAELGDAEELANQVVLDDRPVLIHLVESSDLDRFELRKPTLRAGTVRIVEIEDFDRSACGGPHVRRTGQIGPIKIRRWERRGETTRVEFLCGHRALVDYALRMQTTRSLAERLSVKDGDLAGAVARELEELARLRAEVADARERLLESEASELLRLATFLPGDSVTRLVVGRFVDRPPDELKRLALRVVATDPAIALLGSDGERRHLVFAQSKGMPTDMAALLRQVIPLVDARGGGTRELAQGGSPVGGTVDEALGAALVILRRGSG